MLNYKESLMLKSEIEELQKLPDWPKIKEILCGIAASLLLVCSLLPGGIIKTIVCGVSSLINIICDSLPLVKDK